MNEFAWPPGGPWTKYRGLQDRLMSCFEAASLGVGAADELQPAIAKEMGGQLDSSPAGPRSKEHHDLIRRMALVYGVTLLESMVKDYTRYLMLHDQMPAKSPQSPTATDGDPGPHWWHPEESLKKLKKRVWKSQVRKWSLAIRDGDETQFRDKAKHAKATKAVGGVASSFDHWRVLMASIAVRNCIIHSDGLMNDMQYKKTPLCDVAEEPEWDTGLIFDLFSALDLLNNRLRELQMKAI